MPIQIQSRKDGFRRCGVPHSKAPQTYPDDRWTPEELERLQAEPMLTVTVLPVNQAKPDKPEKPDQSKVDPNVQDSAGAQATGADKSAGTAEPKAKPAPEKKAKK